MSEIEGQHRVTADDLHAVADAALNQPENALAFVLIGRIVPTTTPGKTRIQFKLMSAIEDDVSCAAAIQQFAMANAERALADAEQEARTNG